MTALPSWLAAPAEHLHWMVQQRRLPHALLLVAPAGSGKRLLAERLAATLLCQRPSAATLQPCGQCSGCALWQSGNHPDWHVLQPLPDKQSIGIEQVRDFSAGIQLAAGRGGARVALIDPADKLTLAAANALLKTLEEPPAGAHIVLLTAHPERVPVTIRSRCQRIAMGVPSREDALAWLRATATEADDAALSQALDACGGAPMAVPALLAAGGLAQLAALEQGVLAVARGEKSIVEVAAGQTDVGLALDHALRLCLRGARKALTEQSRIPAPVWSCWHDAVMAAQRQYRSGVAVSGVALVETVLARWFDLTAYLRHSSART